MTEGRDRPIRYPREVPRHVDLISYVDVERGNTKLRVSRGSEQAARLSAPCAPPLAMRRYASIDCEAEVPASERRNQSVRTKVTLRITLYPVILPLSIVTS